MGMGYVIAVLVLLMILGAFAVVLFLNAKRKSNVGDAPDPGADQNPLGILGADDETAAGDTNQLTDAPQGARGPIASRDDPHAARPVVGGEAEGERKV